MREMKSRPWARQGAANSSFLLVGDVGRMRPSIPTLLPGQEAVGAVGEDHVGIGHKHQGDGHVLSKVLHQSKDLVRGDTPCRARRLAPG